jgi:hypothetical protein
MLADLVFDGANLGFGIIYYSTNLFVRLIHKGRCLVFQLISLSSGLFLISLAVIYALSVRFSTFLLCDILHFSTLSLALSKLSSALVELSQPATNDVIMEAKSILFQIFIVYFL